MEIITELERDLGKNLVCITEYGLVEKQYAAVVSELGFGVLTAVKDTAKKLAKKGVYPLFVTTEELSDGRDVFPLEFLNMKVTGNVIYGTNVFSKLTFDKEHVRRELESEFRTKLITLRQGYLEAAGKRKELASLVGKAIPTLAPVCYGMLYLKDLEAPKDVDGLLSAITRAYEVNVDVLSLLNKKDVGKLSVEDLESTVKELVRFLAELGEVFDEMKI
ncbi:MAG: hypothetical protein ABH834_03175 [Candidatus Altiarchaeota archaeon]